MRERRRAALSALGLAALVAAYWWVRLVRPGRDIDFGNTDVILYFYPLYDAAYRWMAGGVLPLWNPYQLCGIPWLATVQGGFFYPPHALYLVLPTHLAMAASSLLHLLLAALSMAALGRRVGLCTAAVTLAAALFTLRGTMPQTVVFPNWLEAAAWLPLGALAVHGLVHGGGLAAAVWLTLATAASWLAGNPQITVYVLYAWGTLLPALPLGTRARAVRWASAGAAAAAAVTLGTMAAAVQLLPAFELAWESTRPALGLSLAAMWPMGDARGLLPDLVAGRSFSFGAVGLSLTAAAIATGRHRALAVWAALVGLLALAFSLGTLTPLFQLYLALPFVGWFRMPSRILFLTDFCYAILAAIALDTIVRPAPAGSVRRLPVALALGAAGVLAATTPALRTPALGTLTLACIVVLILALAGRTRLAAVLLAGLAMGEAFVPPGNRLLLPYSAEAARLYRAYEETYRSLAARAGPDRVWIAFGWGPPGLAPRLPTRYGVRALEDYEPLNLWRQAHYFTFLTEGRTGPPGSAFFNGRILTLSPRWGGAPAASRRRLLDLAAVRYVLMPRSALGRSDIATFVRDAGLETRPSPHPDLVLLENPHVLPRAFTVHGVGPAPPTELLLSTLADPSFDPLAESFIEVDPGLGRLASPPPRGTPATIVRDEAHLIEVEATLAAPGMIVLADAFYPGWEATVDGRAAPIVPVNYLFRGVPAAAGTHRVRFEYRPESVRRGAMVSLAALVLTAAAAVGARRRDRT